MSFSRLVAVLLAVAPAVAPIVAEAAPHMPHRASAPVKKASKVIEAPLLLALLPLAGVPIVIAVEAAKSNGI